LLNVVDWLRSAHTSAVFSPSTNVLLQSLLVPGTDMTVTEYIASERQLPSLALSGQKFLPDVVEGEYVE